MASATILNTASGPALRLSQDAMDALGLTEGSALAVSQEGSAMLLRPSAAPRFTMEELLAQCDYSLPKDEEESEWLEAPRAGREVV